MTEPAKSAPGAQPAPDPFQAWRDWLSQSERQWNEFFNQVMGTDQFGESMGRMMDAYLGTQRTMSDTLGRYFSSMNMPTRTDVLTLGDRLTQIEERLTSIESLVKAAAPERPTAAEQPRKKPARTKKPPVA
jgi:polyhydroxyalkanoic acid synthase PhaR subunit